MMEEPREYLIRKGAYYYRPNAQGYTGCKQEAGLYTFAEAWAYSHPNGEDGPRDGIDFVHQSEVPDPIRTELATTRAELAAMRERADALALQADEWEGKYAIASDMIHQLGENAAKAAREYAEEVGRLHTLAKANNDLARHESAGRKEAVARCAALADLLEIALDEYETTNGRTKSLPHWSHTARNILQSRAALTEPTDG